MHRFRKLILAFILVTLTSILPSAVFSQSGWYQVGPPITFANGYHGWSMFFFSELKGVIGFTAGPIYGIYYTNNGGTSWQKATIPGGFLGQVSHIFMKDTLRGWATIEEPGNLKALWQTNDGGRTWSVTSSSFDGNYSSVYETPSAVIVTSRDPARSGQISINGGTTFQNNVVRVTNGIDFVDDLHGVITGFKDTPWLRTTDGGVTWNPITPQVTSEAWSVYGDKATGIFYAAGELDPATRGTIGNSKVMKSTDLGATWQTIYTFPFFTNGHIQGKNGHLYVQVENTTYNGTYSGLYRSDDGGNRWKSVGGPRHENDKRFFVTGCNGGVVYAFDDRLQLWKTRDGGDGTIYEPNPYPVVTGLPIMFNSRLCDKIEASVKIRNDYCDSLVLQGAEFLTPNDPLITSGAIAITNAASFPKYLVGGGTIDSITFVWDPFKLFHTDTTVSTQVRLTYFSRALQQSFDTVITISSHAIGDAPTADLTPTLLDYQQVNFCSPHDTTFALHNTGCDTLFILSAQGSQPIRYQLLDAAGNPAAYPIRIPPDSVFTYRVRLNLDAVGTYSSIITLALRHQGIRRDTSVSVSAFVISTGSYRSSQSLDFGDVTICAPKDSTIFITNLACDTIRLTSASLASGGAFTITSGVTASEQLLTDSTKFITIRFAPSVVGPHNDVVTLSFVSLGEPISIQIPITGNGTSGEARLQMSPALDTLFDLELTRCDTPRTYNLSLRNPGCKELTINSVVLTSPSSNISLGTSSNLPADFNNGTGMSVSLIVTPNTIESVSGQLRVTFTIEGEAPRDTILFYSLDVDYGTRILSVMPDSIPLGTFNLCTTIDTSIIIRNLGCDTLELVDLTWQTNGGILSARSQPRFPLAPGDTTSLQLVYSPVTSGDISGSVTINSTTDSVNPIIVPITARIIPTDTVWMRMLPVRRDFYVGDTLTVQLIPESPVDVSDGLRDVAFGINFNGDLFSLIAARQLLPNTSLLTGSRQRTLPAKNETQHFLLQGSPYLSFAAGEAIAEFRFYVHLTDTTTTSLFISDIELNGMDSLYAKCTLGLASIEMDFDLSLLCGDSLLREFMRSGQVIGLSIQPMFPNPITATTEFKASVRYTSALSEEIAASIVDARGRVVKDIQFTAHKGSNVFMIDASSLPSGSYHFILRPITSPTGAVIGRFMLEK